jgi:hypothetical protein
MKFTARAIAQPVLRGQRGLAHRDEAAAAHRMAVLPEKLVVERARDRIPQRAVLLRAHARARLREQRGRDAGLREQRLRRDAAAGGQRDAVRDQADRDGSPFVLLHPYRRYGKNAQCK